MVDITVGDVTNAIQYATSYGTQRKMFRNPRALSIQRYYIFYRDNNPAVVKYAWSVDGTTWVGANTDLVCSITTDVTDCAAIIVDDPTNLQSIVYVVYTRGNPNWDVTLRQGTIADGASLIVWDPAGEQTLNLAGSPSSPNIAIDDNGYLWAGGTRGATYELIASQAVLPTGAMTWSNVLTTTTSAGVGWNRFAMVAYNAGIVIIGLDTSLNLRASYCIPSGGAGAPTEVRTSRETTDSFGTFSLGTAVIDNNDIVHFGWRGIDGLAQDYHRHVSYNPATNVWGAPTIIYAGGDDLDASAPVLVVDTSRTPNYIYAIYEHGIGELEWKTTPSDAIAWSGASIIEDHAENVKYLTGWYTDDLLLPGNIYGGFTTDTNFTVRTFVLDFQPLAGRFDVKPAGWSHIVRGKKFFLTGDVFLGQDDSRWQYLVNTTGFTWKAAGEVTMPADRQMTSQEAYAYCILTATVTSTDISDASIGFYADANHYCWIDQNYMRTRNGTTAEVTTPINWANSTRYKIILIWTPFIAYLEIWTMGGDLHRSNVMSRSKSLRQALFS